MPDEDRPPRNQSWSNMGKMSKIRCKTNYSVPADTNLTEIALKV